MSMGRRRAKTIASPLTVVKEIVQKTLRSLNMLGAASSGTPINLEYPVEGPVTLRLEAESSNIVIETTPAKTIIVQGRAESPDSVRLTIRRADNEKSIAALSAREANLTVWVPAGSIGVIANSSNVRIQATSTELEYLSMNLHSSKLRAAIRLKPEGGVYSKLDSSAANVKVERAKQGPYWLEAKLHSSILRLTIEGGADYKLVERKARDSQVEITGKGSVPVRVWLYSDSSIVKLS